MGNRQDEVDVACQQWAAVVRQLYGLSEQRGFLGPLRCTLAARRDLHAGARSDGRVDQHWPRLPFEGLPIAWAVHQAWQSPRLDEALKEILVAHYVPLEPRNRTIRAELMGLSRRAYFERLRVAKAFIGGRLDGAHTSAAKMG